MTTPGYSGPEQGWRFGSMSEAQQYTEQSAIAAATGSSVRSFEQAQEQFKGGFAGNGYVLGEVGRLDNRIDEIVYGGGLAQLATFGYSGTWNKPPNCRKVFVIILGGASGGGRANSSVNNNGNVRLWGLGGFSGAWWEAEFNPLDLPDAIPVVVGPGGMGSTAMGQYGGAGGRSEFGPYYAEGASTNGYGAGGNKTFRIRGGRGGYSEVIGTDEDGNSVSRTVPGATGGSGSYSEGGRGASVLSADGESGHPIEEGQYGMGSGGGGGAYYRWEMTGQSPNGGNGGGGGWPSGPGGGGGAAGQGLFGPNAYPGNGGSGAAGGVFVISYLETVSV